MARIFSLRQLKRLQVLLGFSKAKGFTLLELLVSMLIAALITVLLLGLVVELTQVNQQDAARTQVQQDMQSAMDYIAQDLREAVFVYNGACMRGQTEFILKGEPPTPTAVNCSNLLSYLPTDLTANDRIPVLAFWRTDPIPQRIRELCRDNALQLSEADNPMNQAKVPCVAGNSYSLVVYLIDRSNPNNLWQGKARLARYKLGKFIDNPIDQNSQSTGYVNPAENSLGVELAFQSWPLNNDITRSDRRNVSTEAVRMGNPNTTENPIQVLVDFVDDQGGIILDQNTGDYVGRVTPSCNGFGDDATDNANALSPIASSNPGNYSFYVCVRGGGLGKSTVIGQNQDVQLTLIGNVAGQSGFSKSFAQNNKDRLSPLQTSVLVRGVTKKQGA
jgi:prepilin-type N-terminal cleavage/methylation domain-containing protein